MKKNILLILIIITSIVSCSEKGISDRSFEIDRSEIMYGGGSIISANPFQIKTENGKRYIRAKGGVGGINLKNPELGRLMNASIAVTDSTKAILIIDYPLKKSIAYEINNKNGFGKKDLVLEISKTYSELFEEREKFGICCDELSDLELNMIVVFEKDGKIYLDTKVETRK